MGSYYVIGKKFQLGKMKKFWKWTIVMTVQQCEYLMSLDFKLKKLNHMGTIQPFLQDPDFI